MGISSYSATPGSNTAISGISLAEGCAPSGINDALRQLMADLATFSNGQTVLGSAASSASTAFMLGANNLSEITTAATARTNLGLGSAATQASSVFCQVANNLSDVTAATARTNLGLGTAATAATGTSGATLPFLNGTNTWTGTQGFAGATVTGLTVTGTLSAGSALTMNPYAANTVASPVAHGLGAVPSLVRVHLICLSSDQGYATNDVIPMAGTATTSSDCGYSVAVDGTNIYLSTGNNGNPRVTNKASGSNGNITAANWKLIITPYKIN